jgi:hypothetical protein
VVAERAVFYDLVGLLRPMLVTAPASMARIELVSAAVLCNHAGRACPR